MDVHPAVAAAEPTSIVAVARDATAAFDERRTNRKMIAELESPR